MLSGRRLASRLISPVLLSDQSCVVYMRAEWVVHRIPSICSSVSFKELPLQLKSIHVSSFSSASLVTAEDLY